MKRGHNNCSCNNSSGNIGNASPTEQQAYGIALITWGVIFLIIAIIFGFLRRWLVLIVLIIVSLSLIISGARINGIGRENAANATSTATCITPINCVNIKHKHCSCNKSDCPNYQKNAMNKNSNSHREDNNNSYRNDNNNNNSYRNDYSHRSNNNSNNCDDYRSNNCDNNNSYNKSYRSNNSYDDCDDNNSCKSNGSNNNTNTNNTSSRDGGSNNNTNTNNTSSRGDGSNNNTD